MPRHLPCQSVQNLVHGQVCDENPDRKIVKGAIKTRIQDRKKERMWVSGILACVLSFGFRFSYRFGLEGSSALRGVVPSRCIRDDAPTDDRGRIDAHVPFPIRDGSKSDQNQATGCLDRRDSGWRRGFAGGGTKDPHDEAFRKPIDSIEPDCLLCY